MGYKTDAAKGIGAGWLVLIVIIVLGGLISGGLWAFSVATSGIKGQGDAVKINNSAENWTQKQEKFEKLYQGVKAAESKVSLQSAELATDPTNITLKQTLSGVRSHCVSQVAAYNAESNKVLSRDWKSVDLPQSMTDANCIK